MSDLEPITQEETAWANGDLEPVTRKEQYLNRLTGEEQTIPETPITRTEQYLAKLCGEETEIPSSPITRKEAYLAYLNGEDVTLPEPITRLEQFMAFAAGESETKPTPLTREEFYWDKYQGGAVLKDFPGLPSSIVTVTDALAKPLDSLKVAITPVQSGSGDPSPDNIRPISGWTGCNVTRCGVNLFDKAKGVDNYYIQNDGSMIRNENWHTSDFIKVKGNVTYRGLTHVGFSPYSAFYDHNKALVQVFKQNTGENTISTPSGAEYVRFSVIKNYGNMDSFMVESGSTATTYEPYTGTTYPITFPDEAGTVYGGTLDVVNGTLTVDRFGFSLADLDWTQNAYYNSCYNGYKESVLGDRKVQFNWDNTCLCSAYKGVQSNAMVNGTIALANASGDDETRKRIYVRDGRFVSDIEGFVQEITTNPVTVVLPLATPKTYQLTPTEVQMLLGTNNIWADTGDVLEGKYWSKNPVTVTQAMLSTLRGAGEITPTEEPEENNER